MAVWQGLIGTTVLLSFLVGQAISQHPIDEKPQPLLPKTNTPEDQKKRESEELLREAKAIYGVGVIRQRGDRLIESLKLLEKAAKLDPEAIAPRKAMIPIFLVLSREDEAIDACQFILRRAPQEPDVALEFAKLLRPLKNYREADAALGRGLESPALKERPDLAYQMLTERVWHQEHLNDHAGAEASWQKLVSLLTEERNRLTQRHAVPAEEYHERLIRAYEQLGGYLRKRGDLDTAMRTILQAKEVLSHLPEGAPRHAVGRLQRELSELYFAKADWPNALRALEAYLDQKPLEPEPYERKIVVLRKLNRPTEVIPALQRHAKAMPAAVAVHLILARELARDRGTWAAADQYYSDLADRFGTADVYRGWFKLLHAEDRMRKVLDLLDDSARIADSKEDIAVGLREGAVKRFQAMSVALRTEPTLVAALLLESHTELTKNRERQRDTWSTLAVLAAHTHQLDKAEKLFRQCLTRASSNVEPYVFDGLLQVLWSAHKHAEIVVLCKQALEGPRKIELIGSSYVHSRWAAALTAQGKYQEALIQADAAIETSPAPKARQRGFKAQLLAYLGQRDKAIAECENLLKDATSASDIRMARLRTAVVHELLGNHDASDKQLLKILEDDPNDAEACNNLGYHYADRNRNLAEAEKLVRRAIEIDRRERLRGAHHDPENASYLDSLAWVLFRRGKYPESRELLERAIQGEHGSESAVIWDHLGDVCFQMKDHAQAKLAWTNAVRLFEHDAWAKKEGRQEAARRKLRQVE